VVSTALTARQIRVSGPHPDEILGVSATAVALVALVIGGNTTVFSIAQHPHDPPRRHATS
jgi:hypothetical protein